MMPESRKLVGDPGGARTSSNYNNKNVARQIVNSNAHAHINNGNNNLKNYQHHNNNNINNINNNNIHNDINGTSNTNNGSNNGNNNNNTINMNELSEAGGQIPQNDYNSLYGGYEPPGVAAPRYHQKSSFPFSSPPKQKEVQQSGSLGLAVQGSLLPQQGDNITASSSHTDGGGEQNNNDSPERQQQHRRQQEQQEQQQQQQERLLQQ